MPVKGKHRRNTHKWSAKVTATSDALDLKEDIFKSKDPEKIAKSLKQSAEESHKRKASHFQSAMSMLNFILTVQGKILLRHKKSH
ncbi:MULTISPECIES: DUF3175 domain-containing protein [unclassified Mucilaginibacter]|uniref:DUF3175 domain-containing protein n=1 Tax=unclassified Mucilaginibacter TaxID=2617802 RepID=UPI00095BA639|nr:MULTISPECIES: DUF3175 domain-containing protein [unclassified Mucilaginibacter]OJW18278.1 MAG: hypothetical protein BGO48_17150 [Mucilaginibacter sp. 44-25]